MPTACRRSSSLPNKHNLQGLGADRDRRPGHAPDRKKPCAIVAVLRVATPDWGTIQWAYDKRLTYQRAAELGIDFPKAFNRAVWTRSRRLECRFPVILKPAFRKGVDEFTQAKAWKAEDREQLVALYKRAAALVGNDAIIVQEWIPGGGEAQFSFAALCERGEPIVSLTARRSRQHPIDFGRSSTFVESIEQSEVEELARRFLKSVNYTGVVEVEFKHDSRDGHYKLLDVNGRFWTWNGLGALAGVDFPYLAWRQATGHERVARPRAAGRGLDACQPRHHGGLRRNDAGSLTLGKYLKSFGQRLMFANFAVDDPMPAIVELPVAVWNRYRLQSHRGSQAHSGAKDRGQMRNSGAQRRQIIFSP